MRKECPTAWSGFNHKDSMAVRSVSSPIFLSVFRLNHQSNDHNHKLERSYVVMMKDTSLTPLSITHSPGYSPSFVSQSVRYPSLSISTRLVSLPTRSTTFHFVYEDDTSDKTTRRG